MFGSSILDVALGLVFLYLLLSLLCTALNEMIEGGLNKRAKNLEQGLIALFSVPHPAGGATPSGVALVKLLYEHPLINGLFAGEYKPGSRRLPSYIPARNFALAVMDLVLPAKGDAPSGTAGTTGGEVPEDSVPARLAALRKNLKAVAAGPVGETGVIPPGVARGLLALIDAAGNDLDKVRKNIEDWFDSSMDRVSGWYTRRVKWISFVVGLVLAAAVNADSFAVADALARDQALRASVASAADEYAKAHAKDKAGGKPEPKTPEDVAREVNKIRAYGWPLGWDRDDTRTMPARTVTWESLPAWGLKAFGWVVTAIAITLGAPFWFDVLNRLIVIRSTVKPKEKSPDEPAVDPQPATKK